MPFTSFLLVQVGSAVFATVYTVAQAVLGSLLVAGNVYFDTTNNSYPSTYVNFGAVITHAGVDDVRGGGVRITASGSEIDYLTATYLLPTTYGSGGLVDSVEFVCGDIGKSITGSLVINQTVTKVGSTNGTILRNFIRLSSGSTTISNTGTTIHTKFRPGHYLSFISASSGSTGMSLPATHDCVMKPITHEKYGR